MKVATFIVNALAGMLLLMFKTPLVLACLVVVSVATVNYINGRGRVFTEQKSFY